MSRLVFGQPIPPELLLQKPVKAEKPKAELRMMDVDELAAASCLAQIHFPPASFDKRFGRTMENAKRISDRGAAQLWRIFHRYRRQITHPDKERLLKIAEDRKPKPISTTPASGQ